MIYLVAAFSWAPPPPLVPWECTCLPEEARAWVTFIIWSRHVRFGWCWKPNGISGNIVLNQYGRARMLNWSTQKLHMMPLSLCLYRERNECMQYDVLRIRVEIISHRTWRCSTWCLTRCVYVLFLDTHNKSYIYAESGIYTIYTYINIRHVLLMDRTSYTMLYWYSQTDNCRCIMLYYIFDIMFTFHWLQVERWLKHQSHVQHPTASLA